MYEASFGLKRRPFAATPDATCFLTAGPIQAAFDEIVVCVEQGQGIAVLTAPAGTGKTLLCERLRCELDDRFETVFLRHASFLTRRALLQTVLCELSHAYHQPSEQELRLELFPAIRALQPKREALVLICDEAHQLTDSLLEELRILADFAESGRPLVRLVLIGQLSLEEKLAQPSLEAFNQRIRAHVNLTTFDRAGTLDYIDYRLTWAGGRTDEIFTPAALELIARASDGTPRCVNQLADHTLLLAFVAEQRPAGEELVREALHDLRQLPLLWNEPSSSMPYQSEQSVDEADLRNGSVSANVDLSGSLVEATKNGAMYSYESAGDNVGSDVESLKGAPIVNGADARQSALAAPVTRKSLCSDDCFQVEIGSDDWRQTVDLFRPGNVDQVSRSTLTGCVLQPAETVVVDETGSELARRGQLHQLLQDAYAAAAAEPAMQAGNARKLTGDAVVQSGNTVKDRWESDSESRVQNEIWSRYPTIAAGAIMSFEQTTNGFHEEVIVDRYAAIDAGFAPPVMSISDTTRVREVRTEPTRDEGFDLLRSSDRNVDTKLGRDDFTDLDEIPGGTLDKQFNAAFVTNESLEDVLGVVHDLLDVVSERTGSSGTHTSGQFEDTILKDLRHEDEEVAMNSGSESANRLPVSDAESAWEGIETSPVEAEPRPFRYLFSMLRRKQQQSM